MDFLQGTLDMLVLGDDRAGAAARLNPALKRLEAKGWTAAKWGVSEHNRRAKYCRLSRRRAASN